ncbi:hypothetical protein AB8N92_000501 [Escherichia coli]|nr:hypothetical protein [Escherichia coli]ELB9053406.1 hypothetical protein [Escherichia coli]
MMQIAFSLPAFLFNSINERRFPTTTTRWEVKMKRWEVILLMVMMFCMCIEL